MRVFNKGFNFSQDGPGNRLVYHLKGCNMQCPWCSNPEGMSFEGGIDYQTDQIVAECIRSRAMFFSGGGVTFTGGEATMQPKDLIETLKQLKAAGIHTALETNGTSPHLRNIQEYVDYLIMDFKHYDPEAFLKFTGTDIGELLKNYEYLQNIGRQLHIRIPLINHVNVDHPEGFARYFSLFHNKNTVYEFLPYHEFGKNKWQTAYQIQDGFVSSEQLNTFKKVFKDYCLNTVNT